MGLECTLRRVVFDAGLFCACLARLVHPIGASAGAMQTLSRSVFSLVQGKESTRISRRLSHLFAAGQRPEKRSFRTIFTMHEKFLQRVSLFRAFSRLRLTAQRLNGFAAIYQNRNL